MFCIVLFYTLSLCRHKFKKQLKINFMRTEFINLFAELNASELEQLTRETKETVATEKQVKNINPIFTAANLWNIHNMRRSWSQRRTFLP